MEGVYSRSPYASATDPVPPVPIIVTSRQRAADTIGAMVYTHSSMQFDGNNRKSFLSQPFPDDVIFGPMARSTQIFEVRRPAATAERTDSVVLRLWSAESGWSDWKSISYLPRRLASSSIDSALVRLAGRMAGQQGWITLDSLRAKVYRPRFVPPVTQAVTTGEGRLWLRMEDARVAQGRVQWVVVDQALEEIARIDAPSDLRVSDARGGYAWGYVLDEDDVPHILRYKLVEHK
jgi:hypothetical protein